MPRIVSLWLITLMSLTLCAEDFDTIIRQGRIVDGAGNPAYFGDIAIRDGRIARIGKIDGKANEEIEARGAIVCPGFIDVHTHAEDILKLPAAENFIRMGVTTLVLGNCGSSTRAIANFFRQVAELKVSANVATLIGHGTVRSTVMGGSFMRPPSAEELERMKSIVDEAMKEGALGLSTGLIYLPGVFAKTEEIIDLAKVVGRYDGIYVSHMRDESIGIFDALRELIRIAREGQVRAHVSHIKLSRPAVWGNAERVLAAIESARAEGLDITQDQYVYTASSTGIGQLVPEEAREGGREKFLERISKPEARARIVARMKEKLSEGGFADYRYAVIANYPTNVALNGRTIAEAASATRGSDALDEQIALILEIEQQGGASGVFHGMREEDLQIFARHPHTMFASDSGVRRFGEGVPHPRGYGNNARVLARYVRELRTLRLEDAIRRMTSLPATTFRLKRRGQLIEGNWADVVVFDLQTVRDNATFAQPHQYASGLQHVLVNGISVIKNGQDTKARPGRALSRNVD
jgi:N-acyl-D-amino-acid deacylase